MNDVNTLTTLLSFCFVILGIWIGILSAITLQQELKISNLERKIIQKGDNKE